MNYKYYTHTFQKNEYIILNTSQDYFHFYKGKHCYIQS